MLTLSGLQENFAEALGLFEHLLLPIANRMRRP